MQRRKLLAKLIVLTGFALAASAHAESQLDVTMTVFDDMDEVGDDLLVEGRSTDDRFEEDLFDLDNDGIPDDQEDETGLFDRYRELDENFEIANENDGFEQDDETKRAWEEFATEHDFEEGEKLDKDEFDEIEEPVLPATDPA